ncbi:MAG: hypothetical protein A2Z51_04710 [Deltaproteobacteria bacterium RBG_19FT_COMBO_52_11]|nr:MAG: hypothetical protein A2Z51_04710 [Deltaproteobacteria bacterium RBG_19FT_COMBO_52_11]
MSVLVIDWTVIGALPPTGTWPRKIWRVCFRGAISKGRKFLSTGASGSEERQREKIRPVSSSGETLSLQAFLFCFSIIIGKIYHRRD